MVRMQQQLRGLINPEKNVVPLHLDPVTRSPALKHWLGDWLGTKEEELRVWAPSEWPYNGQARGSNEWNKFRQSSLCQC